MGQKKTNGVLLLYELIKLQQKIVPEILSEMIKRYNILRAIYDNEPVGRRLIANVLQLGERVIRTEVDVLKRANLIDVNVYGMTVTEEGKEIIHKLKDIVHELQGLSEIEKRPERRQYRSGLHLLRRGKLSARILPRRDQKKARPRGL